MAKVLLVEDSPTQAFEMRTLLEEGGHQILSAGNGKIAVDVLARETPDIVVTDLEMPEMNGLQLVEHLQTLHADIPAILVTAQGSEELATRALQSGAASYVPKKHLQSMLNDTIRDVMGVLQTDASFAQLISSLRKNVFAFELKNDASLISPLVALLTQVVSGMELLSGMDLVRMGSVIEHATLNAMYRGNLKLGPSVTPPHGAIIYEGATTDLIERRKQEEAHKDRLVYLEMSATKGEIRIVVRDDGDGFNPDKIPNANSPGTLDNESGRGLVLIQSFADEVTFNEFGNEITIVKRC